MDSFCSELDEASYRHARLTSALGKGCPAESGPAILAEERLEAPVSLRGSDLLGRRPWWGGRTPRRGRRVLGPADAIALYDFEPHPLLLDRDAAGCLATPSEWRLEPVGVFLGPPLIGEGSGLVVHLAVEEPELS